MPGILGSGWLITRGCVIFSPVASLRVYIGNDAIVWIIPKARATVGMVIASDRIALVTPEKKS